MSRLDAVSIPKVILHDHLDGGLRPATVLELAAETGYSGLPASDLDRLAEWFYQGGSASLERYLEAFEHTVGVMQTPEAIERVAYEAVEDLAADGVVYAEIRMAPSLCTQRGLTLTRVIEAVLAGFRRGEHDHGLPVRFIVDAMRQEDDSLEVVEAALGFVGEGVVAFDLAGPEAGFPASRHRAACDAARAGGLRLTLHAGEGDGVASMADAIETGAERIGHGVRIVEDVSFEGDEVVACGPVATAVHSRGIALEVCPTSNLHTGMYPDAASHPIGRLHRAGFVVTLNTDNRLMSSISPSDEVSLVIEHQGLEGPDLEQMAMQAIDAAFCDEATRAAVRRRISDFYS
jgi:adenosine deaminase